MGSEGAAGGIVCYFQEIVSKLKRVSQQTGASPLLRTSQAHTEGAPTQDMEERCSISEARNHVQRVM